MPNADTRDKRAACLSLRQSLGRVYPNPSGSIGQGPRQHIGWCYPGILATAVVIVIGAAVDLTSLFVAYIITRRNANLTQPDTNTILVAHRTTVRAADLTIMDENTMYEEFLN